MNQNIVCKFGGTSLAGARAVSCVQSIVLRDPKRKIVVVSAPGKRFGNDIKVTDMLIKLYNKSIKQGYFDEQTFDLCCNRFRDIANAYNLNIDNLLLQTEEEIINNFDYDLVLSRGEYLMAKIMSSILGYDFIDSKDLIYIHNNGEINKKHSQQAITSLQDDKCYCIPGFYGNCNGSIKTLSRGGSDLTGAIISVLGGYPVYENWTDVDGVYDTDPNVDASANHYSKMSYSMLDKLLKGGAGILHGDCSNWLAGSGVVTKIGNTFAPDSPCTIIHDEQ